MWLKTSLDQLYRLEVAEIPPYDDNNWARSTFQHYKLTDFDQ